MPEDRWHQWVVMQPTGGEAGVRPWGRINRRRAIGFGMGVFSSGVQTTDYKAQSGQWP